MSSRKKTGSPISATPDEQPTTCHRCLELPLVCHRCVDMPGGGVFSACYGTMHADGQYDLDSCTCPNPLRDAVDRIDHLGRENQDLRETIRKIERELPSIRSRLARLELKTGAGAPGKDNTR